MMDAQGNIPTESESGSSESPVGVSNVADPAMLADAADKAVAVDPAAASETGQAEASVIPEQQAVPCDLHHPPSSGAPESVVASDETDQDTTKPIPVDRGDLCEAPADGSGSRFPTDNPGSPPQLAPASREPDEAALRVAEAVVFASVTPVTPRALSQILPDDMDAAAVIAALRLRYEGRGIELVEVGGGLRFRSAADLAPLLRKVVQVPRRLPRVALETLAIVAYHQPVTRPEIEDMRGTGLSQQTLDVLLENDLIVARGRKETPGRPTLWGTTARFLEYFGLRDIRELPRRQDLLLEAVRPEAGAEPKAPSTPAVEGEAARPDE